MKNEKLIKKLQEVILAVEQVETYAESKGDFTDDDNREDAMDCFASVIVSLEEAIEIIERDNELDEMNKSVE